MRILEAREVVPAAPPGLEALRVSERPAEGVTRRLCVAGDVGFSDRILSCPGEDPFREVAPVLRDADFSFANLETPLLEEVGPDALFAAPVSAAPLLAGAGFRLLNLANNHILDHGGRGLAGTREALAAAGLETLGAGPDPEAAHRPVIADLGGLTLGWLGCARTLKPQDEAGEGFWEYAPEELEAAIRAARGRVDVLAVSIHMGYMFVDYPHPDQRRQVLAFLRAGADLVVMHHTHVLQGIEIADRGVACYNLGNLLFDWTVGEIAVDRMLEEQRSGAIFVLELDRRGIRGLSVLPTRVDDDWILRWATGTVGRAILERLRRISSGWRGAAAAGFHRQLADRATGLAVRELVSELRRGGPRAIPGLARRIRKHHLRMLAGWPAQRLGRWLGRRP